MTLIELLAGMAVLGVLVSSALVARGRHLSQLSRAQRQVEAAAAAGRFLQSRWDDIEHLPRSGSGLIEGAADLRWRTHTRPAGAAVTGAEIVAVQVLDARLPQDSPPLTTVEILLPEQKRPPGHEAATEQTLAPEQRPSFDQAPG